MKAVLISIKPKWCDLIRRGRKTVEVRKTCPKLEDFSRHGFCGMNGTGVCGNADCENYQPSGNYMDPPTCAIDGCILYEAPQSWCYVEERGCSE